MTWYTLCYSEKWRDETGYGKRFPEEYTIGALINRFGEVRAGVDRIAHKLLYARVALHNFALLCNDAQAAVQKSKSRSRVVERHEALDEGAR